MSQFEEISQRLSGITEKSSCCRRALLFGMLCCGELSNGQITVTFRTHAAVSAAASLAHDVYSQHPDIYFGQGDNRIIRIGYKKAIFMLKDIWGGIEESGILVCQNCKNAFLRGIFLAAGHISAPVSSGERIELTPQDRAFVYELRKFLSEGDIGIQLQPKLSTRRGMPYIYWKDSNRIQDLLAFIGDNEAVFEFVNRKFLREIRENVNRVSNCEANNIKRSVQASKIQLEAIRRLEEQGKLQALSPELQLTAKLRLDNPELSLQALCQLHEPPLSKGGLNHRLKRLEELSK